MKRLVIIIIISIGDWLVCSLHIVDDIDLMRQQQRTAKPNKPTGCKCQRVQHGSQHRKVQYHCEKTERDHISGNVTINGELLEGVSNFK